MAPVSSRIELHASKSLSRSMTPDDFFLHVIRIYQRARVPKNFDKKIKRGRSRSVSSLVEDLMAYYLISNNKNIETLYVDQPMYFKCIKKQVYPDIAIVKKGVISAFIDLKMDLGWNREGLFNQCKKHRKMILRMRGSICQLRDGKTKDQLQYEISHKANYSVVLISSRNINSVQLASHMSRAKTLLPDVDIFVLSKGHPNRYGVRHKELIRQLQINYGEFARLQRKIG